MTNFLARGKIHIYLSIERGREAGYCSEVLSNSGGGPAGRRAGQAGSWPRSVGVVTAGGRTEHADLLHAGELTSGVSGGSTAEWGLAVRNCASLTLLRDGGEGTVGPNSVSLCKM